MKSMIRSPFIDWSNDASSWMDEGACVGVGAPDMWFADGGVGETNKAKTICHSCPVERQCLERALELEDLEDRTGKGWGVWGGKSAEERNHIRKQRRQAKGPIVVAVGPPKTKPEPKPQGRANGEKCGSEYGARVHERNGELACYRCREARMEAKRRRKAKRGNAA